MNIESDENSYNRSMFFVEKKELLKTVGDIFDTMLETSYEIEKMRDKLKKIKTSQDELKRKISHLRHMIKKDLLISPNLYPEHPKVLNLKKLQMSAVEWNNYINRSETTTGYNSTEENIKNNKKMFKRCTSPDEVSEDINTGSSVESPRLVQTQYKNRQDGELI